MISFLLHGLTCAFWCFVWHGVHHKLHTKREVHYKGECNEVLYHHWDEYTQ